MATGPKAMSRSTASEANNVTPLTIKCTTGQSWASSIYFLPLQLISQRTRSTTWKCPHYSVFLFRKTIFTFLSGWNAIHIPCIPHSAAHHSLLDFTIFITLLQQAGLFKPIMLRKSCASIQHEGILGMEIQFHPFLTTALDEGNQLCSRLFYHWANAPDIL